MLRFASVWMWGRLPTCGGLLTRPAPARLTIARRLTTCPTLLTLLLSLASLAPAEDTARWRLQYFYDQERAEFNITDLKFPSARRGIAVGAVTSGESVKPMSAITSDGGEHWSLLPLKETGLSLFFLNDSLGWMVTDKGLWRTEESGRSWRKIKAPPGLAVVHY